MELPHLGSNCSEKTCHKLDFLPMKCDACDAIFCGEHFSYLKHKCPSAHQKDFQVPVCPLCGLPVPTPRGVSADQTVGQHIDQFCKSPETTKIFINRCMYKNCKKKELIPVQCTQCRNNYCLRHRHFADHDCHGAQLTAKAIRANAAEQRRTASSSGSNNITVGTTITPRPNGLNGIFKNEIFTASTTRPPTVVPVIKNTIGPIRSNQGGNLIAKNIQGDMTEDEALARAMALSIMELDETADRNRRIREQEQQQQQQQTIPVINPGTSTNSKDKCSLS